jgi:glycosyltransferase involved in cell wall biosynthesis
MTNTFRFQVIQVIPRPDGGGAERVVRELTQRLCSYGIESRAIYFSNPKGVELSEREIDLRLHSARDPRAIVKLRHAIRQQLSSKQVVLVHGHLTWPLYFLPLALAGCSVPLIYTEHSTQNKRRSYPLLRPLDCAVYRRYQRVACISKGVKVSLDAWLGWRDSDTRSEVVLNGSRILPFSVRPPHRKAGVRLVSIGSLVPHKGFDIALRAVATLGSAVESYTIVGEGRERSDLESLVRQLGIQDKVSFPGYTEDVTTYLHNADLGIIPSRREGFGLVAIEGLSTGLPIVAFNVDGMREVLEGCSAAHLIKPDDTTSLADGIIYAISNLVGSSSIAIKARRHAERFRIELMIQGYADLYDRICSRIKP